MITPSRIDVFARTALARAIINGEPTKFGQDLYLDFLRYSSPREHFAENGFKVTAKDYLMEFEGLIASMSKNGFLGELGKIPVVNGSIVNGAHRLATAIALGIGVEIVEVEEPPHQYGQPFLNLIGLPQIQQDFICHELIRYCKDAKAFLVFGLDARMIDIIEQSLSKQKVDIFFKKQIPLTEIGARRVVKLAYDHNDWWTEALQETMTLERFSGGSLSAFLFIYRSESSSQATQVKKTLRESLPKGSFDRKIHGSDEYFDTLKIADGLLNPNALHFLNNAPIGAEENVLRRIRSSVKDLEATQIADICFDGSSVMECYGLRTARDLDYISSPTHKGERISLNDADPHENEYSKYPLLPEQVISDPRLHLVIHGFKVISLQALDFFKSFSNDSKSLNDRYLIKNLESNSVPLYSSSTRGIRARFWRYSMIGRVILDQVLQRQPSFVQNFVRKIAEKMRRAWARKK